MTLQLLTILTAAGGMALVALTYNAYPVYFMFATLVAVVLICYASSRLSPRALGSCRHVADRVFANEPLRVSVEVANRGRLPRFMVVARDVLPPFLDSDGPPELVLPSLWPGERVTMEYRARARKRGVYFLGPLDISVSDLFGVFHRHAPIEVRTEAIIYPSPLPLHAELGRAGLQPRGTGSGERAADPHSGLDFYGIRDYQPGDELRRIHWPATARHSRLMVIEFERASAESIRVVLDNRAGTEFGRGVETTLETAVTAAASLIHWALSGEGVAGLAADSPQGPRWLVADSPDRVHEILEMLARLQANGSMPTSALLEWAAPRLGAGGITCVITTTPDEGLPRAIASLGQRQGRIAVVLLDAHSFDSGAGHAAEIPRRLAAAGAATITVRRGDDLAEALGRLLVAG